MNDFMMNRTAGWNEPYLTRGRFKIHFLVSFDRLQNSNFRSNMPSSLGAMRNFDHLSDCKAYKKESLTYIAKQRYF